MEGSLHVSVLYEVIMPKITIEMKDIHDAVIRPVGVQIARDVMKITGLPDNTPLHVKSEFGDVLQPGATMTKGDPVRFDSNTRMVVTISDNINQNASSTIVSYSDEIPPILEDPALGVSLRPVYLQSTLQLDFEFTVATQHEAQRWRDGLVARRGDLRVLCVHQVNFNMTLNDWILKVLAQIHALREKRAGYGDTFPEYFKSMQRRVVSAIGTRDGDEKKLNLVIPEQQVDVQGVFDFVDPPKENKVDGNNTWTITFGYKVDYFRCSEFYFTYPVCVHQSPMPKSLLSKAKRWAVRDLPNKKGQIGFEALFYTHPNDYRYEPPQGGIRIPFHDEWYLPYRPMKGVYPAMTFLTAIADEDPMTFMNIGTCEGRLRWTLDIIEYMKDTYQSLTKRGGSGILIQAFLGDHLLDQDTLYVTPDLIVKTKHPLSMRKEYRIRVGFPTRWQDLTQACIRSMSNHPKATLQIFQSIEKRLDVEWAMEYALLDGQYLSEEYIYWFYWYIGNRGIGTGESANLPRPNLSIGDPGKNGGIREWNTDDFGKPSIETVADNMGPWSPNSRRYERANYVQVASIIASLKR